MAVTEAAVAVTEAAVTVTEAAVVHIPVDLMAKRKPQSVLEIHTNL